MYRNLCSAATVLILTTGVVVAQQSGGVAYPDNWAGGAPLPPIGYSGGQYAQPHVTYLQPQTGYVQPRVQYVQPRYVQPQYAQPQVRYAQPRYVQTYVQPQVRYAQPQYVQPRYAQPQARYVQPQRFVTQGYPAFQSVGPAVSGPPQSRCIVAILNNSAYGDAACSSVSINPADIPFLRQKFGTYQRNSGYVLNLPSDDDYR